MTIAKVIGMPPIVCAPWCSDGDGHPNQTGRDDQVCWGHEGRKVDLSIEDVYVEKQGDPKDPEYAIDTPRLTPMPYRGFNQNAVVYLHLWLPGFRDGIDLSAKLTGAEARQLAGRAHRGG